MHVVLVTTSYPDSQSGSEAAGGFVADFAQQLARHVRVSVVAATAAAPSVRTEGSVETHRFSVRRWPLSLLRPYHPADWWPIVATLREGQKTLREVVETNRPDYILALWALPSGHWAKSMLRQFGIPYGIWALGSDIWSLGRVPILRSYLRAVLKGATHRYADGLQLGNDVQEISGLPCEFLPSARSLPKLEVANVAASPPYRIAFLGRWHPNKGVDIFLESLSILSPEDWARVAEVRIHGGGPLEAEVRGMAGELRALGHPVSVGGYLDTAEATELIAWSDYLMLPSRVESIPVVFSDAAQLGRPLVATPVGDLPRLFDQHEFGILAAGAEAGAFASALKRALDTPPSRFQSSLAAAAEEFDIAAIVARFAQQLEGLKA